MRHSTQHKKNRFKMAGLSMKNPCGFFFVIFIILVQVWGQNSNPNAAGSSCGGVLELSSGVLDFSPVGHDFCMWVIKLPVTSYNVRFQLTQIPESSQLNLYSQEGHVAGQFSILPIATLTSADLLNSTTDVNDSNLIAIWTPSRVKSVNVDDGALLSFKWDSVKVERGNEGRDLDLVGGVNYVEADGGRFSWVKPGEVQQSLLWVLNSDSDSLALKIETDFEKCDLADPCFCSYFGVYEVYDNFLRVVSTECGRSSNVQVKGVLPRLVALGFVNPEFRQDTNHVTLTWNAEETEVAPKTCRSGFPRSCSEMSYESGSTGNSSQRESCLIYPEGANGNSVEVLCDFETEGGGWTIFQKRSSGPTSDFNRTWNEYVEGFGSPQENFWLGLDTLHALTKNGDQELRIDLEDFSREQRYAKYSNFSITDATDFYRLTIGGFSGDAGDSAVLNNGMRFTTPDKDNDNSGGNCAVRNGSGGGWWFNDCGFSLLNGLYYEEGESITVWTGVIWLTWNGAFSSLAKTEIKIRNRIPESGFKFQRS